MECLFYGGGSRRHWLYNYRTIFLGRSMWRCRRCYKTFTDDQYLDWVEKHKRIDAYLKYYMSNKL